MEKPKKHVTKARRHIYSSGAAGCGGKAEPTNAKNSGQPLPCPFCERIFKQDGRLKEHVKRQHEGVANNDDQNEVQNDADKTSSKGQGDEKSTERVVQGGVASGTQGGVPERADGKLPYQVKLPKQLLNEWCQKNKRPMPKYKTVEVDGGAHHCRLILPDPKDSERDVIRWWREGAPTAQDAQQAAAVIGLHILAGERRMDRVLPEAFRTQWKYLEREELQRIEQQKRAEIEAAAKAARAKSVTKKVVPAVFMSDENRRLVEGLLDSASTSRSQTAPLESLDFPSSSTSETPNSLKSSGHWDEKISNLEKAQIGKLQIGNTTERRAEFTEERNQGEIDEENQELGDAFSRGKEMGESRGIDNNSKVVNEMLKAGFKRIDVEKSVEACGEKASFANILDWLVLNIPENELPEKYAASASSANIKVMHRGLDFSEFSATTKDTQKFPPASAPLGNPKPNLRKQFNKNYENNKYIDNNAESQRLSLAWEKWQSNSSMENMRKIRKKLPAAAKRGDLLGAICTPGKLPRVVIVSGMTGSGKSTQVPQFILEQYVSDNRGGLCNIVVTQPRRVAAIGLAERVANERGEKIGESVGYSVRLDSKRTSRTRLLFCTAGVLLRRLLHDPNLTNSTHIILDEIHERSAEGDLLLFALKRLLSLARPDLTLLLMSATADAAQFSGYFGAKFDVKVVNIPGITYPVKELFLEELLEITGFRINKGGRYAKRKKQGEKEGGVNNGVRKELDQLEETTDETADWETITTEENQPNFCGSNSTNLEEYNTEVQRSLENVDEETLNFDLIEAAIDAIMRLEENPHPKYGPLVPPFPPGAPGGAFLVFLPGVGEIRRLERQLANSRQLAPGGIWVLPLHGSLSPVDQRKCFQKATPGKTKVVLATNVAETSITIDDVVYVIDTGRQREMRFDEVRQLACLDDTWVSQASAAQRRGRAGRAQAGCCLRLFSRRQLAKMQPQQPPEVCRMPLEQLTLQVKGLLPDERVGGVFSQLPTPPKEEAVAAALRTLQQLQAMTTPPGAPEQLTPLGVHLSRMPLDVRLGKLLITGAILQCAGAAATIAAYLSGRSPFASVPPHLRDEAGARWRQLAGPSKSDHLAVLTAFNTWQRLRGPGEREFCRANFLSREALQDMESNRREYLNVLAELGFLPHGEAEEKGDTDIHSNTSRVIKAAIAAAFYPNVVRVQHPEKVYKATEGGAVAKEAAPREVRFFTKDDGRVFLHPSSVNFTAGYFESPWLVYSNKVKTSKVFVRESSMVPAYALLLFGGEITVHHDRQVLVIDGWMQFEAPAKIAVLIRELRVCVNKLLMEKIDNPSADVASSPVATTLIRLLTTDGF